VNLASHPRAREYRTALRSGAAKGPNFAGHFTVVTWGCGTSCQSHAIVDAQTGAVYFPGVITSLGAEFHVDSRLFVDSPPAAIRATYGGEDPGPDAMFRLSYYYVWVGRSLTLIDSLDAWR
jgi:hypothetical protein